MKKTVALLVFALVIVFARASSAQVPDYPNGCSTCFVISWVDTPNNGEVFSRSQSFVGGWGFLLANGAGTDRVDLSYSFNRVDFYTTRQAEHVSLYYHLPRYDVYYAYKPYCSAITPYTGFMKYPIPYNAASELPLGWTYLAVTVWVEPYKETHIRHVYIVP